jgi:uncharacterized protein YegJ (DUF2314 family)
MRPCLSQPLAHSIQFTGRRGPRAARKVAWILSADTSNTMASAKHTIVAGEGVGPCRIGANKQTATDLFGAPARDESSHLEFPSAGVEIAYDEHQRIVTIFLFFRSPPNAPFNGRTHLGIGADSSVDDVVAAYGEPTRSFGFTEKTLDYDALGITFTFAKGQLVDIRVKASRADPWQDEWPERPMTEEFSWIAFSSEGGDWLQPVTHAQASFPEFTRIAELDRFRVLPTYDAISVKAFFESVPGNPMFGEHIYLTNIHTDGKSITASLNASSTRRADLKEGQEVTFPIAKLSDWFLVREGKGLGGFTIANVLDSLADEEQEAAKKSPPFSWFSHRDSLTAEEELLAIPRCIKCKRRSLLMEVGYKDGICGICQNGGRRCDCPKCGAPLIRYDKMPDLCTRCLSLGKAQPQKSWWQFWK